LVGSISEFDTTLLVGLEVGLEKNGMGFRFLSTAVADTDVDGPELLVSMRGTNGVKGFSG
jgi:hypothetical protein